MAAGEVVEDEGVLEVDLELLGGRVPLGPAADAEALVEEASGSCARQSRWPRRADFRRPVL